MIAVLTGPVRSGKSTMALSLALASGQQVVLAVGGRADDPEMARRIARHQENRPSSVTVLEVGEDPGWLEAIDPAACLLVDCLGTVLGLSLAALVPDGADIAGADAEERARAIADALVDGLLARSGPTIVVTNEVGWGVVPATPLGRLFRDTLGYANRRLIDEADIAWLVVAGRSIGLADLPQEVAWPAP
ncbi:MAG TPA: bifunctional adenosylcobinamide kinase/adenosylcobinamide-phosphate guanylyltransferase [Coriobacteriia bacterium]|nr:bifunctional adenosylcobinamide kinase/adenosylcobinamide-phosphate guanylyltransferase [Coriobacteriia bacterium]